MTLGARYALAGGAAALVMPLFVMGFSAPVWMGLAAAGVTFAGAALFAAAAPQRRALAIDRKVDDPALRAALAEALPALERLAHAKDALPAGATRASVASIHDAAQEVVRRITAEPEKLAPVQRLLTYYLPRAGEFAVAAVALRERGLAASGRAAEVSDVLARLDAATKRYAEDLADFDLAGLDADMRLVTAALEDDLGNA